MKTSLRLCLCAVLLLLSNASVARVRGLCSSSATFYCVFELLVAAQAQGAFGSTSDAAASNAFSLQQALSGQLNVSGAITSVYSGCSTADTVATAVAEQLSADFTSAAVYCKLVSQQAIDDWQSVEQVFNAAQHAVCEPQEPTLAESASDALQDDIDWSGNLPDSVVQVLNGLFESPLSEATQQQLVRCAQDLHCGPTRPCLLSSAAV